MASVTASTALSRPSKLIEIAKATRHDPLKFVEVAYPWLQVGPLEKHAGPDGWQAEVLAYIRDNIRNGRPLRIGIAGGVGPGKSAVGAWVINWGMATCVDCRCRITANTGPQISTATWPEIIKWQRMSLFADWFEPGDRRMRSADPVRRESWRADAITWDETRPEAFAGFHNAGRRIIYLFDESAAIADSIFREAEGIMSGAEDTEIIWLCLGNPTRNDTTFRTFFAGGKNASLWKSWHIDTRTARMSDKTQIKEWIDSYGIDSDFVRVRVLSQFPRVGAMQFISTDLVEGAAASDRDPEVTLMDAFVMGVDCARFGDDKSVIRFRRGRDARSIPPVKLRGVDTMQLAAKVTELARQHKPDAIFVDGGGPGGGVVDRLRMLRQPVVEVQFGGNPDRDQTGIADAIYANKRAEMWGTMRDWLKGGMIDNDPELKADLTSVEYGYTLKDSRDAIILEKKEHMRKRGLASPDDADALALTFAYPVGPSDHSASFVPGAPRVEVEYDPFAFRR